MRIKSLLILTALVATAVPALMPASAQGTYRARSCVEAQRGNQVGGAILGGLIGGVLGSNAAASGHRGDGTAVGAVLGGLVGQGIGKDTTRCAPPRQTASASCMIVSPLSACAAAWRMWLSQAEKPSRAAISSTLLVRGLPKRWR